MNEKLSQLQCKNGNKTWSDPRVYSGIEMNFHHQSVTSYNYDMLLEKAQIVFANGKS